LRGGGGRGTAKPEGEKKELDKNLGFKPGEWARKKISYKVEKREKNQNRIGILELTNKGHTLDLKFCNCGVKREAQDTQGG